MRFMGLMLCDLIFSIFCDDNVEGSTDCKKNPLKSPEYCLYKGENSFQETWDCKRKDLHFFTFLFIDSTHISIRNNLYCFDFKDYINSVKDYVYADEYDHCNFRNTIGSDAPQKIRCLVVWNSSTTLYNVLDAGDFSTLNITGSTHLVYKGRPLYYANSTVGSSVFKVEPPSAGVWPITYDNFEGTLSVQAPYAVCLDTDMNLPAPGRTETGSAYSKVCANDQLRFNIKADYLSENDALTVAHAKCGYPVYFGGVSIGLVRGKKNRAIKDWRPDFCC